LLQSQGTANKSEKQIKQNGWSGVGSVLEIMTILRIDESTVAYGKLTFRQLGQPRKLKPKPKHPAKIHVGLPFHPVGHHVWSYLLE